MAWKLDSDFIFQQIKENKTLQICILIIIPLLIYARSISYDYTNFDDNGIIQQKFNLVGDISKIDSAFKVDAFFNPQGDFYRPIQNVSFMLDAQVSRNKLWMFHITNILIHLLTIISLFYFLIFLQINQYISFVLSLLFATHPLFASCVSWIPSRGDILIGLLGLQLFMTFGLYWKKNNNLYLILHALLFLITIFTKETAVLYPVFFVFYFIFLHKGKFTIKNIGKLVLFAAIWISCYGFYFYMRKQVASNTGATVDVLGIIPFLKNNPVIPTVVGKFFFPIHLSTLPLYTNTSTIIGIVCLVLLFFITAEKTIERKWGVLMGAMWFLLFAIPPTIYRLENADSFFNYLEHRTYLPMIGIVIILAYYIDGYKKSIFLKKYFTGLSLLITLTFSCLAWSHSGDYKNSFSLAMRAANEKNPSGYSMRANEYLRIKDTVNALQDINNAIELKTNDPNIYYTRGTIFSRLQQHEAAENDFSMALNLNPRLINVYLARSVERRYLKKYESAFRDIFFAATYDSLNPKVYFTFGNLFIATKDFINADSSFSKAIFLNPKYAEAYNNRAYSRFFIRNYQGCIDDCNHAIALMKNNTPAVVYNNMAKAYVALNQYNTALLHFNKALSIDINFADGYYERGKAKIQFNDMAEGCKDLQNASRLGYIDTLHLLEKKCNR